MQKKASTEVLTEILAELYYCETGIGEENKSLLTRKKQRTEDDIKQ